MQIAVTVSPIRTGALKRVAWLRKIVPGPGIFMPSTVEMNDSDSMPWAMRPLKIVVLA